VYKTIEGKIRNYNNMGGDMFWQWLDTGSNSGQQNGVITSDSTFKK